MTSPLAYPSNYNELKILLYEKSSHITHVFFLLKADTANDKNFVGGYYYRATDCASFKINTDVTGIKGVYVTINGTQIAASNIWLQVLCR